MNMDMDVDRLPLRNLSLFNCGAHPSLTDEISDLLDIRTGKMLISSFSDNETRIIVSDSVRGSDVFLVQPTCAPTNENIMNLLIILDSMKRASAQSITAIIPYFGYSRQEKKIKGREPITAKLIANLLTSAGANRVLAFDLHTSAIQGFFDIPVDHLSAIPLLCNYILKKKIKDDLVIVSPDAGGVGRARRFAKKLNASLAIIDKRRPKPNQAEMTNVIGDVKNKVAVIVDDMIDTAGTISMASKLLIEKGANKIFACATHPVLSGPVVQRLTESPIEEVIVTNTIPVSDKKFDKLTILTIAPLISETIYRINHKISISTLFE